MDIWRAVWLTQFIMMFIINAFTLVVFARNRHLRRRNTYLIMNLTVADLLIAVVSGPENILFFKPNTRPKKGFGVLYSIISDMCWIASLGNLVLISLERLHATLYPFRHCSLGKSIYYKSIIFSWFGALTLACGLQISRMNDVPLADRYSWIIYICLTLAVLTTSYVIIMSKFIRKAHVQQLGSVMSAERKLSVTLFIVSAASVLTLLPWVITICIAISSDRWLLIQFTPIASTFYNLNSILNPVIYAIRLTEFRRASKGLFCKNNSYPVREDQPIGLQAR